MGLSPLGSLAHSGESVLSRLRDGTLVINPAIASALLALADCIRGMLTHVDQTGAEGDTDDGAVIEQLTPFLDRRRRFPAGRPATVALDPGADRPPGAVEQQRARERRAARQPDEPGRRAGAGAQRDRAVQRRPAEHRAAQLVAAAQRDHHAAAGRDHEDPHAADRQRLEARFRAWCGTAAQSVRQAASASRWRARTPSSTGR